MPEKRSRIDRELDTVRRLRDELNVQAHLGRAEVRDLWEQAEKRWHELESTAERIRREAREPMEQVGEAAELLIDELKRGYEKLRKLV